MRMAAGATCCCVGDLQRGGATDEAASRETLSELDDMRALRTGIAIGTALTRQQDSQKVMRSTPSLLKSCTFRRWCQELRLTWLRTRPFACSPASAINLPPTATTRQSRSTLTHIYIT
jgi:hypothetical protein